MTAKQIYSEIEQYLPDMNEDFNGTCEGEFNISGTDYRFECTISLTVTEEGREDDYDSGTGYVNKSSHGEVWDTVVTEIEAERVIDTDISAQLEARIMERLNYWY